MEEGIETQASSEAIAKLDFSLCFPWALRPLRNFALRHTHVRRVFLSKSRSLPSVQLELGAGLCVYTVPGVWPFTWMLPVELSNTETSSPCV